MKKCYTPSFSIIKFESEPIMDTSTLAAKESELIINKELGISLEDWYKIAERTSTLNESFGSPFYICNKIFTRGLESWNILFLWHIQKIFHFLFLDYVYVITDWIYLVDIFYKKILTKSIFFTIIK